MKIGRVSYQGRVRMVLVDEASSKVTIIGGSFAQHLNPVQAVIERRITAAELNLLKEGEAGFADVTFLSPISVPVRNIFAVGKNYTEHAAEFDKSGFNATSGAAAVPAFPQIFTKATTSLAGPTDDIRFDPAHTTSVDYEGEIGVVIGAECRNVSPADALGKVFGFVAINDVTARDLQKNHAQWFLGKSLDTFCPVGPWISTSDESTIDSLKVQTWVNGELRQTGVLSDLIFNVPTLIATLSKAMTLLPGDIIATGTPVGVGIGFTPPKFLKDGDLVRVAVTGLGELNNRVRAV
ncbi:fumarylacetoacetate hydrolase family protein [Polaromonas sp. SM01]|uniref:fumarylacetoacetate hydrolase family protein n=1 Tax=Polaromonas sp. SM01 TaxID=3085630 RepID=UPI002980D6B9|nr:fumarylacetoacetate hydrolase family protein [Polaromonas sp. SM01]MDW5442630.1 fumarylacetoacetate hydrolase family protein [Polaromonas sp. SM01]